MKKYIFIGFVFFLFCCKKKESIQSQETEVATTGSLFFFNPYPIVQLGTGIKIYIDDTLRYNLKKEFPSGSPECGDINGYTFTGNVGGHYFKYSVTDAVSPYHNYTKSGYLQIEAATPFFDGCKSTMMINY